MVGLQALVEYRGILLEGGMFGRYNRELAGTRSTKTRDAVSWSKAELLVLLLTVCLQLTTVLIADDGRVQGFGGDSNPGAVISQFKHSKWGFQLQIRLSCFL